MLTQEFRVWDTENNLYSTNQVYYYMSPEGEVYDSDFGELDSDVTNTVIVEQYTGLKDVEGHKIFEGDIVESIDEEWSTGGLTTGTVQYLAPQFTFDSAGVGRPGIWKVLDDGCRVIGNIHENLELMEEDK